MGVNLFIFALLGLGFWKLPDRPFVYGVAMKINHGLPKFRQYFGVGRGDVLLLPKIVFDVVELEGDQLCAFDPGYVRRTNAMRFLACFIVGMGDEYIIAQSLRPPRPARPSLRFRRRAERCDKGCVDCV